MISESKHNHTEICPNCLQKHLKNWKDLSPDEKFVAERLPLSAGFSKPEREQHLFCTNCWYEVKSGSTMV